jgi:hypothetical protein
MKPTIEFYNYNCPGQVNHSWYDRRDGAKACERCGMSQSEFRKGKQRVKLRMASLARAVSKTESNERAQQ